MFDYFLKIFSSKSMSLKLDFRRAVIEDLAYIFDNIVKEASNGHFSKAFLIKEAQIGLILQIQSSIIQQNCISSDSYNKESHIFILTENSHPVGFSWIWSYERKTPLEYELYLTAISPEYRNRGYGTKILNESINQFKTGANVHMRLYAASKKMHQIAVKRGFVKGVKIAPSITHLTYTII